MSKFFKFRTTPPLKQIQVGFFWQENTACVVYFEQEQPHSFYFSSKVEADSFLQQFPFSYQLIQAVSYSHIWRKTLILPSLDSSLKIEQQAIQILKQSLPLDLAEIVFDYQVTPLDNNQLYQMKLYALRKSEMWEGNAILDCELHCLLRGIVYLSEITQEDIEKYCYQVQGKFIQYKDQQLTIEKQNLTDSPVFNVETLSQANDIPHFYPYLIALGASLWNGKASI
ncbi:competence protein ComA [Glaesserella parasuis]|uniref:competence protein ComA n=1 Tax=Glaesserella parasuis TaxID=738 RepID=UPI00243654F4|nr:competence protein ComA [Glaesserella parasuis]MDG6448784.1 competence protein ComA [Glaesserella parasuis]MDG6475816.1 competence protein ComA [Glaesserella parasuis]